MQFDPFSLPSASIDKSSNLPPQPGIYFVLHGQNILYIGKASSLRKRWASHHRRHELNNFPGSYIAYLVADIELIDELERSAIAYFCPALNGKRIDEGNDILWLELPKAEWDALALAAKGRRMKPSDLAAEWIMDEIEKSFAPKREPVLASDGY